MNAINCALNGIHCHFHCPSYQGMQTEANRMLGFSLTGSPVQARSFDLGFHEREALRAGVRRVRECKPKSHPVHWSRKPNWFRSSSCLKNWPPLSYFCKAKLVQKTQLNFYSSRMPLRGHASPSRGRRSGKKADSGGRGTHNPQRISPLACVSPNSQSSDDSDSDVINSVQTIRFKYIRRSNKPIISAILTVVFSEENDEVGKGKVVFEEQGSSPTNSSKSGSQEESSYLPSSQSKLEEESTGFQSKEQTEALKEICSLMDMETNSPEAKKIPEDVKKPDRFFGGRLYPVLPPGFRSLEDIPCGVEIECLPDPEREEAEWRAEQEEAMQRAHVDQANAEANEDQANAEAKRA